MAIFLAVLIVLLVGADQLVKYWAIHELQPVGSMDFIHIGSHKIVDLTYLENDGAMLTGWLRTNLKWYCFDENGVMRTGWFRDMEAEAKLGENEKREIWYYADEKGIITVGWKKIDGKMEYFDENGVWQFTRK